MNKKLTGKLASVFIKLAVKPRPSGRGYKATRKTRIKSMVFRVF
jgi:hypothetical protein